MLSSISIDEVRSYWNSSPCNIRHSPKEVGTLEYFDEVATRKYFVEPHILQFADFSHWNGKKVLEIGCGIGTDTISFAKAGAVITAVDLSEESLKLARKRAEIYGCNVQFYQANCEELSKILPIETYDLVYSFGVIHHTPCPERAINEIKKYMGPNSLLKLMVYHRWSYKVFWILFKYGQGQFRKLDELIAKYSEAQTGCPVTYTYSKRTVRELLKDFKILKVQPEHIFPYRIPEYKNYQYKLAFPFNCMPRSLFRWLEKRIGWHLCITAEKL